MPKSVHWCQNYKSQQWYFWNVILVYFLVFLLCDSGLWSHSTKDVVSNRNKKWICIFLKILHILQCVPGFIREPLLNLQAKKSNHFSHVCQYYFPLKAHLCSTKAIRPCTRNQYTLQRHWKSHSIEKKQQLRTIIWDICYIVCRLLRNTYAHTGLRWEYVLQMGSLLLRLVDVDVMCGISEQYRAKALEIVSTLKYASIVWDYTFKCIGFSHVALLMLNCLTYNLSRIQFKITKILYILEHVTPY